MSIARIMRDRGPVDSRIVAVTELERLVIRDLYQYPGSSPSELSARVKMKSSNTSAILRTLEAKGFVERHPDQQDGRSSRIFLTDLAHESIALVQSETSSLLAALNFDGTELDRVVQAFSDFEANLLSESNV